MGSCWTDWLMPLGNIMGEGFDCGCICCRVGAARCRWTLMALGTWLLGARDEGWPLGTLALTDGGAAKRCWV